jgi:hypothetical protein
MTFCFKGGLCYTGVQVLLIGEKAAVTMGVRSDCFLKIGGSYANRLQ